MHKSRRGAAFYVETILLVLFLLFSLAVLVRMLGAARQFSAQARQLSCAVRIAQDAAEQAAACDSPEDLAALLGAQQTGDGTLAKAYDAQGRPLADGVLADGAQAENGALAADGTPAAGGTPAADGALAADGVQAMDGAQAENGVQAAYSLLCRVDTAAQGPGTLLTVHFTVSNQSGVLYELETQKYLHG